MAITIVAPTMYPAIRALLANFCSIMLPSMAQRDCLARGTLMGTAGRQLINRIGNPRIWQ